MRYRFALILAASIAGLFPSASLTAQSPDVEVRVRLESPDGTRLSGALVALVTADNRVVTEGISADDGSRLFRAPPGSYVIRVRRIGFLPFLSPWLRLPRSEDIVLSVESARVALGTVTVTSRSKCGAIDRNGRELSVLWDEIAK
ncbi:MAG TPA: carboxypeptidase-like regulatory domain-containing protein, partial [Gemmatimonadaceae bacterium]|nr:carboxypeptidase-like regulatory domain-containing protein [Gemmatimonadaceae bacterium]